jgi:hypothetical protein
MKRLAFFVEGHTEVVLVDKLLEEIAGKNNVLIEHREIRGGTTCRRTMRLIKAAQPDTGQEFFVLIVDCGGDNQVKTRILDEHENLTKKGYWRIIGLRDIRPQFTHADIPKLEASLPKYIKTSFIPVQFVLSIMEIEAWFLAETTHFEKIHPAITLAAIQSRLGFDPENDDMEQRLEPAKDLDACYQIGGRAYRKHAAQDTADALDYSRIYMEFPAKFRYVKQLVDSVNAFLS